MQLLNISPPLEGAEAVQGPQLNLPHPDPTALLEVDQRRREKRRAVHRSWVARNKERRLAYMRKHHADNKAHYYEVHRKWRLAHMDVRREYKRQWNRTHKESI